MMRQVLLEGNLGDKFGSNWNVKAKTLKDVFECITANYPSFRTYLVDAHAKGTCYSIQYGEEFMGEEELTLPIGPETVIISEIPSGAKSGGAKILAAAAIIFVIWATGGFAGLGAAGGGAAGGTGAAAGTGSAAAGSAAATSSAATSSAAAASSSAATASTAAKTGWAVGAKGGLSFKGQAAVLLATNLASVGLQQLLAPDPSVDNNDENYLFDGAGNTIISGQPVPYLFGRKIVGGATITTDIIPGNLPTSSGTRHIPYPGWTPPGAPPAGGDGGSGGDPNNDPPPGNIDIAPPDTDDATVNPSEIIFDWIGEF